MEKTTIFMVAKFKSIDVLQTIPLISLALGYNVNI